MESLDKLFKSIDEEGIRVLDLGEIKRSLHMKFA